MKYTPSGTTPIEEGAELPARFALGQNYPNPFNPQTTIRYELAVAGRVTLKVFDVLGREVAVLVDGLMATGMHEVTFDARDLPSGVYLYRLAAGDVTRSRSMLLVK